MVESSTERSHPRRLALSSHDLSLLAGDLARAKKASNVVILDLRQLTSVTDFFVICSGAADIHVKAIAESIRQGLAEHDQKPLHTEGMAHGTWVLIDYVDVVVHIFLEERRKFYGLERLWGDAPMEKLEDE
jgi:ribosome-associated protein